MPSRYMRHDALDMVPRSERCAGLLWGRTVEGTLSVGARRRDRWRGSPRACYSTLQLHRITAMCYILRVHVSTLRDMYSTSSTAVSGILSVYIYISGGLESRVFCIEIEISCRCFGIIFHVSVSFSTLLEVSRECMWVKIICNLVHGTVVIPLCVPIWGCYIVFFQKRKPKFMPTY